MVIEYAVGAGKYHMRYIEKVALTGQTAASTPSTRREQHLCRLERRRQAGIPSAPLCGTKSPHSGPGRCGGDMDL